MVRIAPLVPMVMAISPFLIAFTPRFESTPSLAPITKGVFGSMPICLAKIGWQFWNIFVVGTRLDS